MKSISFIYVILCEFVCVIQKIFVFLFSILVSNRYMMIDFWEVVKDLGFVTVLYCSDFIPHLKENTLFGV